MLRDDVVDASILLGEGDPEVALEHIGEEQRVLLVQGLIQAVGPFQVGAYFRRDRLVVHQRVAGDSVHPEKRRRGDKPDGDHPRQEPSGDIAPHQFALPSMCARGSDVPMKA